jgi:hypothetical protein
MEDIMVDCKVDIMKKVNTQLHVKQMKIVEELGIPVLTLNIIMVHKSNFRARWKNQNKQENHF